MKFNKLLVLLGLLSSLFTNHISTPVVAQTTQIREVSNAHDYNVQWTNDDFGNYYSSIDFSSYSTLLDQLQDLNSTKRKRTVGYGSMWDYFDQTDYNPSNKSQYIAFYKGTPASRGEMNKEHVWPKSHGSGGRTDNDIHMVRPTLSADNSSRGNSFYVEGMNHSSNGWDPKTAGMNEQYRGQAARIIFYCVVADEKLSLVDTSYSSTSNANPDYKMGKLSDLLKWNLQYAVDITELNRNNGAEDIQGNRNPFIDNPYLACAIWGNYNDNTRAICADYGVIVDPYTGDITLPDNPGGNTGGETGGNTGTTVNWGTASSPLTTSQAISNMSSFAHNETSTTTGYVKGIVTSVDEISATHSNITLTLDNTFTIYRCSTPNGTYDSNNPEVKVGDEIVVSGTFKKFYEKYEIDQGGSIISINSSGGSTTPDTPIVPDDPIVPDTPIGGTTKESISFDFSNAGISSCGYTDGLTWNIDGKNYFASHAYVADSDVRLGHNQVKSLDGKFGLSDSNGSYLEPLFDLEKCQSISLEVKAKYGTTNYKVLFKETNKSTYSVIKEGSVNGPMTIEASLSSPKDGRFIIVIVGTKPRIQLGEFSISVVEGPSIDLSTLSLNVSSYEENNKSCLRFKGEFNKSYLESASRFGIMVFSKNQLGNKNIEDLYQDGDYLDFVIDNGKYDYLDFDFTSSRVESNGKYVFGAVINNIKGHEDYKFVAVLYAEIGDELYFSSQVISSYNDCK
ncbi:MAG: hypothetical protein E7177_02375 [Erysipelotrichaceae bacterium]|nr:hypothetical protein [Erysipelotrichaceae bacterium]